MKKLGIFCLLIPFVLSSLNAQGFITMGFSKSYGQIMAYLNVIMVAFGGVIFFRSRGPFAGLVYIWFVFFACYFIIGSIAGMMHNFSPPLLAGMIPVIYLIGFSIFLSIPEYRGMFASCITLCFFISCVCLIVFQKLNFSYDATGIAEYTLDRAGGVYGDANQSALVCLLTLILIYYLFIPTTKFQRGLKILALGISLYAFVLTFSKTGFVILVIIAGLAFRKSISVKSVFLGIFALLAWMFAADSLINVDELSVVQKERLSDVMNILTLNTEKVELSSRDVLLDNMLNYVYDNPILGNGVGFSNSISGHNTIIGVWADAGIIAFLIFLLLLFRYFTNSINLPPNMFYLPLLSMIVLTVYMLTLQSIINQPYLIAFFVYLAYFVDGNSRRSEELVN